MRLSTVPGTRTSTPDQSVTPLPVAPVRLQVLGRFRLSRGDSPIELGPAGSRLVALLALNGRRASRDWVAGQLWADSVERRAASSLRAVLHRLPVGCRLLDADRHELRLAPDVHVDFDAAVTLARSVDALAPADEALLQWRELLVDDVLPDWYDTWLDDVREQHRQRRLHALEQLCELQRSRRRHGAALEAGLTCLASEPLRESAHRVVIETHLAENNVGEALRQYRACRRILLAELGVAPSPQLRALVQRYLRDLSPGVVTAS